MKCPKCSYLGFDTGERCLRPLDVAALDHVGSQRERAPIGLARQQLGDPMQAAGDRRRVLHARGGVAAQGVASLPLRFDRSAQRFQLGVQPRTERGDLIREIEVEQAVVVSRRP